MQKPIGVFDSGFGGLTVLNQLIHNLPHEHFVYYGDTARFPYGEKSRETIMRYSIENSIFLIEKNIKLLVVACHTASAFSLERLKQIFNIPIFGVIEPGVEQVIKATKTGRVAVLGTKGTIRSESYQKIVKQKNPHITVMPIACPLLAPLVEEHFLDHPATRLIIREYLRPLKESGVDALLLGCTHYPLLKQVIQEEVGDAITLVDSSKACAEYVKTHLEEETCAATKHSVGKQEYFVSDDPCKFQRLGELFLGHPLEQVSLNTSRE